MEARLRILDRHDADVGGEDRVQRALERGGVMFGAGLDARNLSERVDSRIGPAGPVHGERPAFERSQRLFEQPLDRDAFGLTLPANVVRPVVLDGQLQRALGHGIIGAGRYEALEPGLTTGIPLAQSGQASGA